MRRAIFLSLATLCGLAACSDSGSAEAAACRDFIKAGLRSPSTYQEVKVAVSDDETVGQFDRRNVSIEYDAANAFGTPVRGVQLCSFEIDKKSRELKQDAKTAATLASADRALGRGDGSCCVPYPEPDPNSADANMTMDDFLDNNIDNLVSNGASN